MEIYNQLNEINLNEPSVAVLGKFDGLHKGHRLLLKTAEDICREKSWKLTVFTIKPPAKEHSLLMSGTQKREAFEACGVDILVECDFEQVKQIAAEDFLEKILWEKLCVRGVVAGTDCRFGQGRSGDASLLSAFMAQRDCQAVILDKLRYKGREISSTYVREAVCSGNMELAEYLLGHSYGFMGIVVKGSQLGRTMEFPTVNLIPDKEKILPPFGVYRAEVLLDGKRYLGVSNVGVKPTVGENAPCVETFLIDFQKEIYGKKISVLLKEFIRPEKRFDSIGALRAQIKKDIDFVCK